jgi:hypothetical protein
VANNPQTGQNTLQQLANDEARPTAAAARRNLVVIAQLANAGAKLDVRDMRGRTPLDYALLSKFVPAIKLLDREKRYQAIVEQFSQEFPPAPVDSPLLGQWTNDRDGFNTVVIKLDPDGTGLVAASVGSMLIAWRSVDKNEGVAFAFNEKGEVGPSFQIKLSYDPAAKKLTFAPSKGEQQKMIRMK